MNNSAWLAFAGGIVVGLLAAVVLRRFFKKDLTAGPTITEVNCAGGRTVEILGGGGSAPAGTTLVAIHVKVFDNHNHTPNDDPRVEGAVRYAPPPAFPFTHTAEATSGPPDLVVVWAEYLGFAKDAFTITCMGSGSPGLARQQAVSPAAAEQLEAIPQSYRVSPSPPAEGPGAALDLVRALAGIPEAVLHYAPEASTPTEPFWRARDGSGPVREWALRLLPRQNGFEAVLSVVGLLGGREFRLTWVGREWRFHADNRLTAESEAVRGLSLSVRPA
jgi:hypothetical protein